VLPGVLVRYETGERQRVAFEHGRERIGERVSVGILPEHCHLFGKEGRAVGRRIAEVPSVA
jgi:multiple sugar transport system ATP-binding protein